jgi:hypothetical protein
VPAIESGGPNAFRGSRGVGDKGVSGDRGVASRSGPSSRAVGVGTSSLVVSDVSEGPATLFVGGVDPWSFVHGGRVVVASWAPRWLRAAIEAVVSGSSSCVAAVGVLVADKVGPKGVGTGRGGGAGVAPLGRGGRGGGGPRGMIVSAGVVVRVALDS